MFSTSNPFQVLRTISKKRTQIETENIETIENNDLQFEEKSTTFKKSKNQKNPKDGIFYDAKLKSTFKITKQTYLNDRNIFIIFLKPSETFIFQGKILIIPINGQFEMNGYIFNGPFNQNQSPECIYGFPCYAPRSTMAACLTAVSSNSSRSKNQSSHEMSQEFKEKISKLYLSSAFDKNMIAIGLMPLEDGLDGLEDLSAVFRGMFTECKEEIMNIPGLLPIFDPIPNASPIHIPFSWSSTIDDVLSFKIEKDKPLILCTIGQKNKGKSTFSRYSINRLLNSYSQIAYLECDMGQSEFTPPGLVSLHIINTPILGPSFTHLQKPVKSHFMGATSPKQDPDYYIASLIDLFTIYKSKHAWNTPLVINTQGWIKGMGFDLLVYLLQHILPSHLVNVTCSEGHTFFQQVKSSVSLKYLYEIDSVSDIVAKSKMCASDYRTAAFACYFSQESTNYNRWDFNTSLSAKIPYEVSFKMVKVKILGHQIPVSQILYSLNASIVGLMIDRNIYETANDKETLDNEHSLGMIPTDVELRPRSIECIGLGIVRSIGKGHIYILTNINVDSRIEMVNLLMKGNGNGGLDIPIKMLSKNGCYVTSLMNEGMGKSFKKTRHLKKGIRGDF